jgi:hypothetical protein
VTDPVYALIITFLLAALVTAMVVPAPVRAADREDVIQLSLQGAACVAIILMGALAMSGHPAESTVSGALAWLIVMPCLWLSRAPGPNDGWYEEEDDEDGGGGSPPPRRRPDPPAPDDRLPGLAPPAMPAARAAWTAPTPQPAPVLATAARVKLLLAAEEAQRTQAAQEVQRRLAAAAAPRPQPQPAPVVAPPAPVAALPEPVAAIAPDPPAFQAPLHTPDPHDLRPAPRVRGDHRSIVHVLAAVVHASTRRRAAADRGRRREPAAR